MLRVVLDTNVLVSGVISEKGSPRRILAAWKKEYFVLVTSIAIIAEIVRVLHYPHIKNKYRLEEDDIQLVETTLANDALVLDDMYQVRRSRDPEDDIFLACALEGRADYIVSGDPHLLEIKYYHGVQIISPSQLLEILEPEEI
ncbi:MAG: putative toxin-antitoxin system toxin component, PIN family [Chloroflexi bacterium]|nr:putative toxin-antitoxin system toxin component, PIN family [Chloroflexota bacterium]